MTYATRNGRQLPTSLRDMSEWRKKHDDLTRVVDAIRRATPIRASAELPPFAIPAKTITEWDPLDLGLNQSISDTSRAMNVAQTLPSYIVRSHDEELRSLLSAVEHPLTVMLIGESSTGKTRACLEAVRACLPSWPIIHPSGPEELRRGFDSDLYLNEHVLWLDEAQSYLDGKDSSQISDALTRMMLSDSTLSIVIGTMWPKYWRDFTGPPPNNQPDYSVRVRKFLRLSNVKRIKVPDDFGKVPLTQLAQVARQDSRLNIALRSGGNSHRITQVLAGGVQLLDRYQNTLDPHGRAVITAAMDLCRLGYQSPITPSMLQDAVPGYLSARDRAVSVGWLATALEAASQEVNGVRALGPLRIQSGMGDADAYILHDYLANFSVRYRKDVLIPRDVWEALHVHATESDDRIRLAWEAVFRHLDRLAVKFLTPVVNSSYPDEDGLRLVWLLENAGHEAQALNILRNAADGGEVSAMKHLADRRLRAKDYDKAVNWLRRAANLSDNEAMYTLGTINLGHLVPWQEADDWLLAAAMAGNVWAMRRLAWQSLDSEEAIRWLRLGAETGEGNLMLDLVQKLEEIDERAESLDWIRRIDEAGHLHIVGPLAKWLEEQGRSAEGEALLRRNSVAGDMTATSNLSRLLEREGRIADAVSAWRVVIESMALSSMSIFVARQISGLLERSGEKSDAVTWLREAVDRGSPHAALVLVAMDQIPDAEDLLRRAVALGNDYATPPLVELLERQNRAEEAEALLRVAVESSQMFDAWEILTNLIERTGRVDEARNLRRFGMEPGGQNADPW